MKKMIEENEGGELIVVIDMFGKDTGQSTYSDAQLGVLGVREHAFIMNMKYVMQRDNISQEKYWERFTKDGNMLEHYGIIEDWRKERYYRKER